MKRAKVKSPPKHHGGSSVPLEAVLRTRELDLRGKRPPDYETENRTLTALAQALADSPGSVLQAMAEILLETFHVGSSGFSLLHESGPEKTFVWPAIAGEWKSFIGGGTPRDFGPCGDVLDCNAPLLFAQPELRYPYFLEAKPLAEECLLVPFYVHGKAIGTIWLIAHDEHRKFDSEDLRQLTSLGSFASSAYQLSLAREKMVSMNEALVLGALRQNELAETAESLTGQLNREIHARIETARQLAEKARLIDLSNDAIIVRDLNDQIRLWNRGAEKLFGWTSEEVLGNDLHSLLQTEFPKPMEEIRKDLLRDGRFNGEVVQIARDGRRIRSLCGWVLDRDTASIFNSYTDITERTRTEEALRENELRLRHATESARLTYVEADLANGGARTAANFPDVMGFSIPPDQENDVSAGTRVLIAHVVPADRPLVQTALRDFLGGLPVGTVEYRVLGDDQVERWIESKWTLELGPDGKPVRSFATNLDITECKCAGEALQASEERFRAAVGIVSSIIWTNNADGLMEGDQPGWGNFTGQTHAEYQGYGWAKALHPQDAQRTLEAWKEAVVDKRMFEYEHRIRRRDGEWRVCSIRAVPLLEMDGTIREWVGVHTDITERQQAEHALRDSEERYRTLFESMDEGFCIIEMIFDKRKRPVDYMFLEANPAFYKHTGLEPSIGQRVRNLIPGHEEEWYETYGKVALTGEPIRFMREAKGLGGRWFDAYACRVGGEGSHKVAIVFNDITERKKTGQELEEKARLLDLSHDAIIVRDVAGHIRYWNKGAEELYGWSREEVLGKLSHLLLRTVFPVPLNEMVKELYRTDRWIGELGHTKRDGKRVTVLARKTLERDAKGHPLAVLENLTDITAHKIAEKAELRLEILTAANAKLKKEIIRRQAVEGTLHQTRAEETRLLVQSRQQELRLRELSHQIIHAQEEERKRISRELHDVIAQTLVGINVHVAALAQETTPELRGLRKKIASTHRMVEKSVEIVHQFARELRPTLLDDLGLIPALKTFLKGFMETTGIRVSLKAFAGIENMSDTLRTTLYRIAQEALANVASHSKASKVEIVFQRIGGTISMEITDDGHGFEVEGNLSAEKKSRLGLIGMRERAEMIGGVFTIDSAPGKRTTVRVGIKAAQIKTNAARLKKSPKPFHES